MAATAWGGRALELKIIQNNILGEVLAIPATTLAGLFAKYHLLLDWQQGVTQWGTGIEHWQEGRDREPYDPGNYYGESHLIVSFERDLRRMAEGAS